MGKKQIVSVEKSDLDVQSIEQMIDRMGKRLSFIWGELDGNPEAQASVVAIWEQVQQLGNVNNEHVRVMEVIKATLHEAVKQRDFAVIDKAAWEATAKGWEFDVKQWSEHGVEMAQERLAGVIAVATELPVTDVARVLDDLLGDESIDEEARHNFIDKFMEYANRLYAEQAYRNYADDETDEFAAADFEDEDES